ncbi:hypothetical protein GCM10010441_18010 [Kitasatospora paracochleata]|uniref:Uncharacterized protein n=1 Tax=Kitasatospora paracochleata TaxID=58354 RepID=A0ABT1J9P2_9ACTN|nr:hypothetical protein [Kitasatospora paracochleata]
MYDDLVLAAGTRLHGLRRLTVRPGHPDVSLPLPEPGERGQAPGGPVGAGGFASVRTEQASRPWPPVERPVAHSIGLSVAGVSLLVRVVRWGAPGF